jgi:hypothetical protein
MDVICCLFIFFPADIIIENILLRRQVRNFKRENPGPHIKLFDRIFWVIQQLTQIHHLILRTGGGTRCVLRVARCAVEEL